MEFFAPFVTTEGWVSLLTLIFLEIVLGIDNLVFIAITTDRLPAEKQHIGRRFGLVAALIMRVILLCFGAWIIHLTATLFTLPFTIPGTDPAINARDLILLVGGGYLIYKGIAEIIEKVSQTKADDDHASGANGSSKRITLSQAIATIAVMDMIFSLDSVITALGLSGELIIMILAVMIAVFVMIIFADPISNFINSNPEMKILALFFIVAVGLKLVAESLGVHLVVEGTDVEVMDLMLYFAMVFSLIITFIQMICNKRSRSQTDQTEQATLQPKQDTEQD